MFKRSVLLLVILSLFAVMFSTAFAESELQPIVKNPVTRVGDVNGDGKVNVADYTLLRRYILDIIQEFEVDDEMFAADVNGDGKINAGDYLLIRQFILRVITKFPKESVSSGFVKFAGGSYHTVALKADGTVWGWGDNRSGQLGFGETAIVKEPTQIEGLTGIKSITAGLRHSLSLSGDGTVQAWGINSRGQLVDETEDEVLKVPFMVETISDVKDIQSGFNRTLLIKEDGTVWMCSTRSVYEEKYSPAEVKDLGDLQQIDVGIDHIVALKKDGTVWSAGDSYWGQLGNGTQNHHNVFFDNFNIGPVTGLENVVAVEAGANFSLALKNDGTVSAWGCNISGELGHGNDSFHWLPVNVEGLDNVIALSSGNGHSIALKADGTVWTWGKNNFGQLGNNSNETLRVPVQVEGLTGVSAIKAGADHSMAIKDDGTVWAWGRNDYGQLGDGTTEIRLTPVQVKIPQ